MQFPRRFKKSSAGVWLPTHRAARGTTPSMVRVFAQHDVVFPDRPNDFEEFKRLVRSLSRTDALLWCARLNLHFGHAINDDPKDVQKQFVSMFFDGEEVARLNRLVATYGEGTTVFFRGQLLELMRWVALLSTDQAGDGMTFRDRAMRQVFARAALLASDVWSRRVYPDELKIEGGVNATRRRVLAMLRQANIETSDGPHPLLALARGVAVAHHLRRRLPDANDEFRKKTRLSFDEYFSLVAYLMSMSLRHPVANAFVAESSGLIPTAGVAQSETPLGRKLQAYFALESQGPAELRDSIWGGRRADSTEQAAQRFLLRPLRAKPILQADADRAIILDAALFAERPTAGPLFHLVAGQKGGAANQVFGAFGDAFEDYVRDVMGRIFPESTGTPLARRYLPNPKAIDQHGNELEIADGILLAHEVAVLFEAKAVWIREDMSSPDTHSETYIEHLREHYGVSSSPKTGNRGVKGVGQLARAVKGIGAGSLRPVDFSLDGVRRILPVLLVHDVHLNAPAHPHFLAEEFAAALGKDDAAPHWREMRVGAMQLAHLLVLTVDDLELLETSTETFAFLTCLQDYVVASADRMTSFYNFLVTSRYRERLRYSKWLGDKCDELLDRASEHLSAE